MSDARKVRRGHRRGEGRGARGGKGPDGTLGFLTRFCTRCDLRPLRMNSDDEEAESWEVKDEAFCSSSSLSTTFTVAMASVSVALASTAASMWMKSAITESSDNACHSSASISP